MKHRQEPDELPRIKNQLNAHLFPKKYERNNLPSETKPNMSMTILQMIERHRRGLPIDAPVETPLYQGEELVADISSMDLIDRQAYIDSVADQLVEVRTKIQADLKTKKEKDAAAKFEAAVQAAIKKLKPTSTSSAENEA